jgi:hypothetical protein
MSRNISRMYKASLNAGGWHLKTTLLNKVSCTAGEKVDSEFSVDAGYLSDKAAMITEKTSGMLCPHENHKLFYKEL